MPDQQVGPERGVVVSVGLPTYNRRTSLERAVDSVLAQVGAPPIELVISDNASTDDTPALLAGLRSDHGTVQVIAQPTNIGPTPNFRAVADRATGSFFMWLGDDDWLDPNYVADCVARLAAEPELAMVAGIARYHDGERSWLEAVPVDVRGPDPRRRVLDYYRQVRVNGVFYGLVRDDVARRLGALPNRMGGDWLHVAAIAFHGGIATIGSASVHRSVGGATVSLADVARHAGLGWFQRTAPQLAIAGFVVQDIGWRNPAYDTLGRPARLWLGVRAGAIVCRRFVPEAFVKFVRQSLRRSSKATP